MSAEVCGDGGNDGVWVNAGEGDGIWAEVVGIRVGVLCGMGERPGSNSQAKASTAANAVLAAIR